MGFSKERIALKNGGRTACGSASFVSNLVFTHCFNGFSIYDSCNAHIVGVSMDSYKKQKTNLTATKSFKKVNRMGRLAVKSNLKSLLNNGQQAGLQDTVFDNCEEIIPFPLF